MDAFVLESWHWWALGLIFVVIEGMLVTGWFAALAMAALIVGFLLSLHPTFGWPVQVAACALLTFIFHFVVRKLFFNMKTETGPTVNEKVREIMGRDFELQMPILNNYSELEINGTTWQLKGRDQKEGTRVRVIGLDGDVLVVAPVIAQVQDASLK